VQQPKKAQDAAQRPRDRPDHSGTELDERPSVNEEFQLMSEVVTLPVFPDDDEKTLDVEDDRRSLVSKDSSMTLWSSFSGDTAVEMEGATVELLTVFQDSELLKLYRMAMQEGTIRGPVYCRRISREARTLIPSPSPDAVKDEG
jgi:hypothetical protein